MPILPKSPYVLPMYYPYLHNNTPMIHYENVNKARFVSQADHFRGWRVKNAPALGVVYTELGRNLRAREMLVLQVFSCALGVLRCQKAWANRMSRDGPEYFFGRFLYDHCMTPSKSMTHTYYYTIINLKSHYEQHNR